MINWTTEHLENDEHGQLIKVRIGTPTDTFWRRWKTSSDELREQKYTLFYILDTNRKRQWFVKHFMRVVDNPSITEKDITYIKDKKLRWYQEPHFNRLYKNFHHTMGVTDNSDTGTGKTIVGCTVAKNLKVNPAILCPLQVIPTWIKWCKYAGIKPLFIANYEAFKGKGNKYGYIDKRYYPARILQTLGAKYGVKPCVNYEIYFRSWHDAVKHLKKIYSAIDNMIAHYARTGEKSFPRSKCCEVHDFHWNVPKNTFFIYDEAHKCKGPYTQNAKMLIASKPYRVLLSSATLAESPRDMRAIGYILGLHNLYDFNKWSRGHSCFQNHWNGWECTDPIGAMKAINSQIIPLRGSRMCIKNIPDFPKTQITAEAYESDIKEDYNKQYHSMLSRIDTLETEGTESVQIFTEIVRFRQASELMKVPLYVSLAKDAIENKLSVIIFVNYTETRELLQKILKTDMAIYGTNTDGRTQKPQEREWIKEQFQGNKINLLICMSEAGGTGLDLHDVHGGHQRMSIISPTYNARTFKQIFGRPHRDGSKSTSLQRVIYLDGTIEETVCENVNKKIDNISAMNDGDLMESDLLNINTNVKGVM